MLIGVLALLLLTGASSWPWEAFLHTHYVMDNSPYTDGYPRRAANRFRLAEDVQAVSLLPELPPSARYVVAGGTRRLLTQGKLGPFQPSEDFKAALQELLECRPDLIQYADELYVTERITSSQGNAVTALLDRPLDGNNPGSTYLHLVTLIYRSSSGCAVTDERPATMDAESSRSVDAHGGYDRRVWDLLSLGGITYVVTLQTDYEARCFQVYRVKAHELVPEAHVSFSCLGCK